MNTANNQRNANQLKLNLPHRIKIDHVRRRHRSKTKARSNTIIHVNIRSIRNNSIDCQNSLHSIPNIKKNTHHQQSEEKNQRNDSNSIKHSENTSSSANLTKVNLHHQFLSQSSQHILQTNYSTENLHKQGELSTTTNSKKSRSKLSQVAHREDVINNDGHHLQTKDAWLDKTGNTTDYHQNAKKNKKKKRFSRIVKISIITAAILTIAVMIILLVLLIKSKAMTTTPRIAILRWNNTGITVAGVSGVAGNTSDKLYSPFSATVDYQNSLYIADTFNHRIQKYLMGASTGTTVAGNANATSGTSLATLNYPSQALIVSNGNMFVADTNNRRVMLWSNGSSSGVLVAGVTGIIVPANNTLNTPYRIDYDLDSNSLYVADYLNTRVMRYLVGASSGSLVAGGNGSGKNITQLTQPVGIYFDSLSNSLVIANHFAHNIVRWPLGATSWTLLAGDINGNLGDNATMLRLPTDVTFDPMGNMYVADRNNLRIQLFLNSHTEGITIAGYKGVSGNNSTLFTAPWSVALDSQLNLYVADSNNHRVQKFLRY